MKVNNSKTEQQSSTSNGLPGPVIRGNTISSMYQCLCIGVDTMRLNVFVSDMDDIKLYQTLSHHKSLARNNNGEVLWKHTCAGDAAILYKGISNYEFHIKTIHFDVFLNCTSCCRYAPNVCFQFSSDSLWSLGLDKTKDLMLSFISELGGSVDRIQINRLDLYADFSIPEGLTYDCLNTHIVSLSHVSRSIHTDGQLGTYYVGTRGRILFRVYNKSVEIIKHHRNFVRYEGVAPELLQNIWRIEFEVGRKVLHKYAINDFSDIQRKLGGLWHYLTTRWLSLRLPNNNNTSRRLIHPWWLEVQNLAPSFGTVTLLCRDNTAQLHNCDPRWYIAHIAGCLPAFAVLQGKTDLSLALQHLSTALTELWDSRDFDAACRAKAVQLGIPYRSETNDTEENKN